MTSAALALALAVLVAPAPGRRDLLAHRQVRLPRAWLPAAPVLVLAAAIGVVATPGMLVAAAVAAATVAVRQRRKRRRRRRAAEAVALQGALDVVVGELRVGAHPVAAFAAAAGEVDGVVREALRMIAGRARVGADVADGMRAAAARSALPEHWENLATCWHLAQSQGLAIATLMKTAARDVVERERFAARVDAGLAGARATAAVLAALPVFGVVLGQLMGADPAGFLLSDGPGGWLLSVGTGLACAGLLWSDRITDGALR